CADKASRYLTRRCPVSALFSMIALLATLVLLFSFQGETIVEQPLIIAMLAVPILVQTLVIAAVGYWLCRKLKVRHDVAGPAAMIGASNFFELAVAVAIVLYGFNSGAARQVVKCCGYYKTGWIVGRYWIDIKVYISVFCVLYL